MQRSKFAMGLAAAWLLTSILTAGEMEPWAPPGPTMKPLDNIEPRTALHPEMFPLTIETPGSYYLAENIIASGGIVIVADGVTIDLNGFTLAGDGSGAGIVAVGSPVGIRVRNGTVTNWTDGVDLALARGALIEGLVATYNGLSGIVGGNAVLVADCRAEGNGADGIVVGHGSIIRNSTAITSGASGISAGFRALVESCTASGNAGSGISVDSGSIVSDCSASSNLSGIALQHNGRVAGSIASFNHEYGIVTGNDCVITYSAVRNNLVAGISVGAGAVVRNCTAGWNDTGIFTLDGSLIESCAALGNVGDGIVAGHGSIVRGCNARDNGSNGIYATYGVDVVGNVCSSNGSAVGGDGAGIYVEGVDNRVDANSVMTNDRGIETAMGGNTILRNNASGNGDHYGAIASGNDVAPVVNASSASNPWANVWY
jgi:hypothetical protein